MNSFKKIIPFIIVGILCGVGGYFIGREAAQNGQASLYLNTTLTQPVSGFTWICKGFQGCWCEKSKDVMAPSKCQIDEKSCKECTGLVDIKKDLNYIQTTNTNTQTISPTLIR